MKPTGKKVIEWILSFRRCIEYRCPFQPISSTALETLNNFIFITASDQHTPLCWQFLLFSVYSSQFQLKHPRHLSSFIHCCQIANGFVRSRLEMLIQRDPLSYSFSRRSTLASTFATAYNPPHALGKENRTE